MIGENGQPATPDWHVTPHPAPEFERLARMRSQALEIPENITLSDN